MKRVLFHIGHGKTGTSAIQSFLARNREKLLNYSISYPDHRSLKRAAANQISSGNVTVRDNWLDEQVLPRVSMAPSDSLTIFSAEALFEAMDIALPKIAARRNDFDVRILLFVRNPLEMLQSHYQQAIKRGGEISSLEEFIDREGTIGSTEKVIRFCEELGVPIQLVNYSVHRNDLINKFLQCLPDTPDLSAQFPASEKMIIVNRSHTTSELNLIREINRHGDKWVGQCVSDALVNELPNIRSEATQLSEESFQKFSQRVRSSMDFVNTRLPASDQLNLYFPGEQHGKLLQQASNFSQPQIDVIAKCIQHIASESLKRHTNSSKRRRRNGFGLLAIFGNLRNRRGVRK